MIALATLLVTALGFLTGYVIGSAGLAREKKELAALEALRDELLKPYFEHPKLEEESGRTPPAAPRTGKQNDYS